jgi:hypothetical protein
LVLKELGSTIVVTTITIVFVVTKYGVFSTRKAIGRNLSRRLPASPRTGDKADPMSNIEQARKTLLRRVLEGPGKASLSDRRAAFDNSGLAGPLSQLVDKVARNASCIADEEINQVRQSGLSEDQIFEIVVCAAIGQASRQFDAAKAALEAARRK